jgi:hypothetical protein
MSMNEPIRDHLEAIDAERDVPRLLDATSIADRSWPVALQWVRLWYPLRAAAMMPRCTCAVGRCAACN